MSGRAIITASLAVALGIGGVPCLAFAEESVQAPATLDEAWATYGELSLQVAEVGESLNDTYYRLGLTEADEQTLAEQVAASTERLAAAREVLGNRISANYKAGYGSLLDLILGTDSFEGLVSALHYVDKLTDADVAAVNEVRAASEALEAEQADLEATQEDLRTLAAQKEQQLKDLQASLEQQRSYIESLSAPLRAAFDERQVSEIVEQQAAAVEALAAQEAALAQAAEQQSDTASDTQATSDSSASGADVASAVATVAEDVAASVSTAAGSSTSSDTSSSTSSSSSSSTSSLSSDARAAILEAAYSQLGVTYSYGASSPGEAFDCSGLTSWAYSQAGIDIPHSSAAQAELASTVSSSDDLQPGDLVFYIGNVDASQSGNHVAIYAGDGQVIHANGSVVTVSDMNENWTSAGSIGLD